MSRPAVSQHVRILLATGLVSEQRYGRERYIASSSSGGDPSGTGSRTTERFWDDHLQLLSSGGKGNMNTAPWVVQIIRAAL